MMEQEEQEKQGEYTKVTTMIKERFKLGGE